MRDSTLSKLVLCQSFADVRNTIRFRRNEIQNPKQSTKYDVALFYDSGGLANFIGSNSILTEKFCFACYRWKNGNTNIADV